jgi:hypothetical protein
MKFMEKVVFNTAKKLKSTSLTSNENNEDENELIASSSFSSSHTTTNETTNELCMLLSKLNVKNLLMAHDQVAQRFDEQKNEQQKLNKALMIEQQNQLNGDVVANLNLIEHKDIELKKVINSTSSTRTSSAASGSTNNSNSTSSSSENEEDCDYENFVNKQPVSANNNNNGQDQTDGQQKVSETNGQFLSEEGRFLLSKAQHYAVDNLKLVNIEKPDAPLGATIRNRDGCIVIGRIVVGGAAEQSGLLHEDDEILEINNIPVRGKTINDVCDMLCDLQGIISFLIIPNMTYEQPNVKTDAIVKQTENDEEKILHIRALYNYIPQEDFYIPCKELGVSFSKGDIMHVISQVDEDWWQAYRDDDKDQSLAGLIPSQSFQERRCSQLQALIGDSFMNRKKRKTEKKPLLCVF